MYGSKLRVMKALALAVVFVAIIFADGPAFANNPCIYDVYTADPTPLWANNTMYIYCSHDANFVTGQTGYDIPNDILISSTDLVNWEDDGVIPETVSWTGDPWRPAVIYANGYYYLYFTAGGGSVGVLRSTSPAGPFTDPIGGPLVNGSTPDPGDGGNLLDPAPFIDANGQAYLYFGGGGPGTGAGSASRVIELNANMISVNGSGSGVPAPNFFEQSGANLRNGVYYFSYSSDPAYGMNLEYIMANNPLFTSPTIPAQPIAVANPGASNCYNNEGGRFVNIGTNWYAAYFNRALANANGLACSEGVYQRSVCFDQMNFNADGTIQEVTETTLGPTALMNVNPYSTHAAACMAAEGGVAPSGLSEKGPQSEACSEGGRDLTDIEPTDWVEVRNLDFTCASAFTARVASAGAGGVIQIHLDSATGPLIGTCDVPATGGTQTWTNVSCPVTGATGLHDIYFVFSGTTFNFESYSFASCGSPTDTPTNSPSSIPTASPTRTRTLTATPTRTASPSATATATKTVTKTVASTSTLSASPTASATKTDTATATASQTATTTLSASPSVTASVTKIDTATATVSPSSSYTAGQTATATLSASPTVTASGSPSLSATSTPSGSPTNTPSVSVTPTRTWSVSPTATGTPTDTGTATNSVIPSELPSLTLSPTKSPTVTSSADATALPTATATAKSAPSPDPSASSTAVPPTATVTVTSLFSVTSAPSGGQLVILSAVPVPNPNPGHLDLDMQGSGDGVVVSVYTKALVLVTRAEVQEPLVAGWNRISLGTALQNLPMGLYYVQVHALRGGVVSNSVFVRVFLTKR